MQATQAQSLTLEVVRQFIQDAIADGWASRPLYSDPEFGIILEKNGMTIHARTEPQGCYGTWPGRGTPNPMTDNASLSAWGSDGLVLQVSAPYDAEALVAAHQVCGCCGATDVETHRYHFAGRACAACLPDAKAKTEVGNWYA